MTAARLRFLAVVTAAGLLAGPAHPQQQPKVPRVAFLSTTSSPDSPTTLAFRRALRELGYVEGQNIVIEWRWGGGSTDRFPEFAAEAVRLNVDVIVAANDAAGRAAQEATRSIPIVIAIIGDAVGSGFAAQLSRPGGNVTGSTTQIADLTAKRMQLLKEAVPGAVRIALLVDTNDQSWRQATKDAEVAARQLRVGLVVHEVSGPKELHGAFRSMVSERVDAVLIGGGTMFYANRGSLADEALRNRLPLMCQPQASGDLGCLMSYGSRLTDRFERAALLVDKILKGAKPAELPIEQPTAFELVVNKRTAGALGLAIPESLLLRADQLVE